MFIGITKKIEQSSFTIIIDGEIEMETLRDILMNTSTELNRGITFIEKKQEVYYSYADIFKRSLRLLKFLQKRGIKKGDYIIFQCDDNIVSIHLLWACILGGAIPVPYTKGFNSEHFFSLEKVINSLNAPYVITDEKYNKFMKKVMVRNNQREIIERKIIIDNLDFLEYEGDGEGEIIDSFSIDEVLVLFSSGTTGEPKGISLSNENVVSSIKGLTRKFGISSDDAALNWTPFTHVFGLIIFHLTSTYNKVKQYVMPIVEFVQNPELWIHYASKFEITQLYSPNFGYKLFIDNHSSEKPFDWDLSKIRLIINGSELISTEIANNFFWILKSSGLKHKSMSAAYGLTEATSIVSISELEKPLEEIFVNRDKMEVGDEIQLVSKDDERAVPVVNVGTMIENCTLAVLDDVGNILKEGLVGNINLKGKVLSERIYTTKGVVEKLFNSEYLDTGDVGFIYQNNLYISGRKKDMFIINGKNYYAYDVERVVDKLEIFELGSSVAVNRYNQHKSTEELIVLIECDVSTSRFKQLEGMVAKEINRQLGIEVTNVVQINKIERTQSGKVQRPKMKVYYEKLLQNNS